MRVVTFYSYKGGTGRSLLLANTALFLQKMNKKVFLMDFDFEAPGLPYKFKVKKTKINGGFVNLIYDFQEGVKLPDRLQDTKFVLKLKNNEKHAINLLPAGSINFNNYVQTLTDIKWRDFFSHPAQEQNASNFFRWLFERINEEYNPDYILIDSRTGITDIGGTALNYLSDQIVLIFLSNKENESACVEILNNMNMLNQKGSLGRKDISLLLSRVPAAGARDAFNKFRSKLRKKLKDKGMSKDDIDNYLKKTGVLQSDSELQINEELRLIGRKRIGESHLIRDYFNFLNNAFPEVTDQYPNFTKLLPFINSNFYRNKQRGSIIIKESTIERIKKRRDRKLLYILPHYTDEHEYKIFSNAIMNELKMLLENNQTIEGIFDFTEKALWSNLAIQLHENKFDFCGEAYFLSNTRSHLVDILQFGEQWTYTCFIHNKFADRDILFDNHGNQQDKLTKFLIKNKRIKIGLLGDHVASSEANDYILPFIANPLNAYTSATEEKLLSWLTSEDIENKIIICDHVDAEKILSLVRPQDRKEYHTNTSELTFSYRESIPVGFAYPKGDSEWRRAISKAVTNVFISNEEPSKYWQKIKRSLVKEKIKPLSFKALCKILVFEMTIDEALEIHPKLMN